MKYLNWLLTVIIILLLCLSIPNTDPPHKPLPGSPAPSGVSCASPSGLQLIALIDRTLHGSRDTDRPARPFPLCSFQPSHSLRSFLVPCCSFCLGGYSLSSSPALPDRACPGGGKPPPGHSGHPEVSSSTGALAGEEPTCNAGDLGWIPGLGRSPGEGNSYPLQYPGLENPMGPQRVGHD